MKINTIVFALFALRSTNGFTAPSPFGRRTALASSAAQTPATTQAPPPAAETAPPVVPEPPLAPQPPMAQEAPAAPAPDAPYYAEQPAPPPQQRPTVISDQEKIWGAKGGEEWKYSHRSSFEQNPAYIQPRVSYPPANAAYARPSNASYSSNARGQGDDKWYHAAYSKYDQNGSGGYENRHRPPYSY